MKEFPVPREYRGMEWCIVQYVFIFLTIYCILLFSAPNASDFEIGEK